MLTSAGVSYGDVLTRNAAGMHVEKFTALGGPSEIIEQTARMLKAGVDHVCFGHPLGDDLMEAIRIVGDKIIPFPVERSPQPSLR